MEVLGSGGGNPKGVNVLLPHAVKRVELINFSEPKWSFMQSDSTDCKLRETKGSTEVAEWFPS